MRIFISGGSGTLGQYLNQTLSINHDILTQYKTKLGNCFKFNSVQVDITDHNKINSLLIDFKPDIILHTAAISSFETAKNLSSKFVYDVNVNATRNLAQISSSLNAKIFYFSTDLVYAGYRGSMIEENGKLIPFSFYAETKLMGEEKIKAESNNYVILRTGLLYGFALYGATNYFNYMVQCLQNRKPLKLFYDQYRTPLSLWEASRIISELLKLEIRNEIINLGGLERISRLELGERLCQIAGFDRSLIKSISMNEVPDVPNVADVSMSTKKLQSLGIMLKNVGDSLTEIMKNNNI
jgi:dTDP-4-dehydrorhamnose reductase